MTDIPVLAPLLRRLSSLSPLCADDRAAVLALPHRVRAFEREAYFVREGERTEQSCLLLDGYAYRQKATPRGTRQILSLHMAGDFVDLPGALLNVADHNVQALTRCTTATVTRAHVRALAFARPAVALAMWIDTLIDASIAREWIANIGRRSAQARIAHLLCEIGRRLEAAELGAADSYHLPMTQEQLADATGMTPVHVNRTLRELDRSGVIVRTHRTVEIRDWDGLCELAEFNENYLHLDQAAAERSRVARWVG